MLTQNIIIYKWKQEKSTSTIALKIYKSTTFYIKFLHSTRSFTPKFYIYKHPYFLQFYNIFLVFFYILHWFFWPNLQSTKQPTPPLRLYIFCRNGEQKHHIRFCTLVLVLINLINFYFTFDLMIESRRHIAALSTNNK